MDLFPLAIHAIRPSVTRDEAVKAFEKGIAGGVRRLAHGPLRSIADVYVPFRLYHVTTICGARRETAVLGIDAVTGALDLYRFDAVPAAADLVDVRTRNHIEPLLSEASTRECIASRVTRMMFGRVGFFAGARIHIDIRPAGEEVYVPYWAGFFGRRQTASLLVMDAVRRQIEGIKVRRIVEHWLATV